MTSLDKLADKVADLVEAKAADTWVTVWLSIVSGAIFFVSAFWLLHQVRMIGGM